jgi:fucose permease
VILPYSIIALVLSTLGLIFSKLDLPNIKEEEAEETDRDRQAVWQYPHLILGALAIFFYVGVEVISYDTFSNFGETLGFPLSISKGFATYTGYGLLAGYFLSIRLIPKYVSQKQALVFAALLSMVFVLLAMILKGNVAVICFALLGFSNSVMWPAIWPLAIGGLGKHTKMGSALLIMGIVGGAILPPFYGFVADLLHSRQMAYGLMIPCYLFILFFAVSGYKVGMNKQ